MVAAFRGLLAALNTPNAPATRLTTLLSNHLFPRVWTRFLSVNMFKKAVEVHKASQPKSKSLANQLFPSSSPSAPTDTPTQRHSGRSGPQPLSATTGNIARRRSTHDDHGRHGPIDRKPVMNIGVKRTSSGLEKALNTQKDEFGYPNLPLQASKPTSTVNDEAFFDENDFDSDLDLDVEDPSSMTTVQYPKLPPEPKTSSNYHRGVLTATPSLQAPASTRFSVDSGYESQKYDTLPADYKHFPSIQTTIKQESASSRLRTAASAYDESTTAKQEPTSSAPMPWSSSPSEHFRTPPQAFKAEKTARETPLGEAEPTPRPTKRRALPWLQEAAERDAREREERERGAAEREAREREEEERSAVEHKKKGLKSKSGSGSGADFTPLPKNDAKSAYPWNTTFSAMKEGQKNLRQANKLMAKDSRATEEEMRNIVEKGKRGKISKVFLSEEQRQVLNLVTENQKSVFFTGSAGTGKSVLLREIIATLRRKYAREPDRVAVTASTGLAACNVGGVTLHSFSGIGLGKESVEVLVKKIRRNQKARHRWMRTKVLIVDEVSMVDGDMFDKLEAIARTIRNNGRPFGGIQIVITGDFFQLPPVPESGRAAKFAFEAGTWNTCIEHTIALHHVFRQKDPVFANMLNEMREGRLSAASISSFKALDRPLPQIQEGITATELFPTRSEVDRANHIRMHALPGETRVFEARDGGTILDKTMRDKLLSNCMAPENVSLKIGAQVMLIKNMDETLVNGSLGKVVRFMTEAEFESYHEDEDSYQELQHADEMDLNPGQLRAKKKLNLASATAVKYPMVRFAIADGTHRELLCQRESWKIELPNGEVQASRSQIPLILAWALSIHKAQGQTLECVKVDLGKVFEKGQAYVALSRATSMQGLQVLRFDARKVVAHERVRSFYKGLSRVEEAAAGEKSEGPEGVMGRMMKAR